MSRARPAVMIMGKWRSQQPKPHDHQPATGWAPVHALWAVVPPSVLVVTGIFSVQFGAGLAARLFAQIPPAKQFRCTAKSFLPCCVDAVKQPHVNNKESAHKSRPTMRRSSAREAYYVH